MRGAAPASRLSHATAAVSPPCGSELAALVAAAVAPARDVGDGAVLVTFGGCSPEPPGMLFGDHDLEVPRSTPTPLLLCRWGPRCEAWLFRCRPCFGLSGRQGHGARLHMQRCVPWPCGHAVYSSLDFARMVSKTFMELCPCSSHAS